MAKHAIAVVGATGKIGGVLTEELLKRGHEVRALGRNPEKLAALQAKGAKTTLAAFDDEAALTSAFQGAQAAFTMIAPSYFEDDFAAWQDRSGEAIVAAVVKAGLTHVVDLSSVGAQHPSGTGPIAGLHRQEKRFDRVAGLNVLHLRPAYFMENHYWSIPTIKTANVNGGAIFCEVSFSQVATGDIARKAADCLERLDFQGRRVLEFGGPRELTLVETTRILGRAIGKPLLRYVEFPYEEVEKGLLAAGMPPRTAHLLLEMYDGFNEGLVVPETPLTERGTKTLVEFADEFARAYTA